MSLLPFLLLGAEAVLALWYLLLLARAASATPSCITLRGILQGLVVAALAGGCGFVAVHGHGWSRLCLWPTACLALLATGIAGGSASIWLKHRGRVCVPARLILAPWALPWGLWRWRQRHRDRPGRAEVVPGVWIGHLPPTWQARWWLETSPGILDLAGEHSAPAVLRRQDRYRSLPLLLGAPLSLATLTRAADAIAELRTHGSVLVLSARGRRRSTAAIVAYLLRTGQRRTVEEAEATVAAVRPGACLDPQLRVTLAGLAPSADAATSASAPPLAAAEGSLPR